MLIAKAVDFLQNGYEGYDTWYLWVAGWGCIIVMLIAAFVLPQLRWSQDPDRFDAWPTDDQLRVKGGAR